MLEHVTANQTRFMAPGLTADARGVALGRSIVVLLPSLDRVLGLLRGLSERMSLDDVIPALKIHQVKTPLASREFLVQFPVTGSHTGDSLASVATLMGGLTFTGSAKHFVRYRDSRSPLGYDVDSLQPGREDFVLYDVDFVQGYSREREIPFAQLVLSLSPQVERGDSLLPSEDALLRVVPGLWRAVVGYLHRNACPCEVAACESTARAGRTQRFYLIRSQIARRMEGLLRHTPGIELLRLVGQQVAVQVGYRHPVALTSCASIFEGKGFYLFSGTRQAVEVLENVPHFVSSKALVDLGTSSKELEVASARSAAPERVAVALRLAAGAPPRPVLAARIPLQRAEWLKKLTYFLPPSAIEGCSMCLTDSAIFLYGRTGLENIPLGEMFCEEAPGVLVPLGMELVPRVRPEVLAQHLGSGSEHIFFFTREDPAPLHLSRAALQPLSRGALAAVEARSPLVQSSSGASADPPSLVNDALGVFPLWGFSDTAKEE